MDDREEQIKNASYEYTRGIIGWSVDKAIAFEKGAEWADNNPKFINMKTKEIIIPQGWEIDEVRGNKIILMESKKELPKTWEKCCELLDKGEFIDINSGIVNIDIRINVDSSFENTLPIGLGEPMLALCQLLVCREIYRQGWKPDWTNKDEDKYCIINNLNKIEVINYNFVGRILSFQSEEVRDQFLENFRDLIEEAKELI